MKEAVGSSSAEPALQGSLLALCCGGSVVSLAPFSPLPTPSCLQKIREAMTASLQVLRNGRAQPFTQRELLRAKRTLLTRHESDLKVGSAASGGHCAKGCCWRELAMFSRHAGQQL